MRALFRSPGLTFAHRLLILFFTSDFFNNWVRDHVRQGSDSTFNPYLSFLFYALAALSAVRFVGSSLYLLLRLIGQ